MNTITFIKKNCFLFIAFFFLSQINAFSQTIVTIGTSTLTNSNNPLTSSQAYNYTQQIYTAAEITAGGGVTNQYIHSISFYWSGSGNLTNANSWDVYLGNTATAIFSGTSSWIAVGSMSLAYSGNVSLPGSGGWMTITLTTPFKWTGSNLVVAIDENTAGTGTTAYWRYTSTSSNYRALYKYATADISPSSPGTATGRVYNRPNIQLDMGPMPTTITSQDFSTTSGYTSTGWQRSNGTNYMCDNYGMYSTSSTNYLYLNDIHVPRGKGVKVKFNHKYYSSTGRTITVYARVGGYSTFNTSNKHYNSWMQVSGAIPVSSTTCTQASVDIPGDIVGGQDLSILFVASNTNACIDNIVITDGGPAATVPDIGTAPYIKTFDEPTTEQYFYGPFTVTSGFYLSSTSNNIFSYRTNYGNNNGSGAYSRITSTGGNNGKVNSSASGYCAYISGTTADVDNMPAPSGYPCIITRELNTSTCSGSTATLRFAFRQTYSGFTSDEVYTTYCPRIFYKTTSDAGTGYSWTQATVNYYFPDGQWWYAATSLPKAQNLIVAFAVGTASQQYNFDDIKVVNRDCSIASKVGEAISCTSNPGLTSYSLNTPYTFTIANASTGATHWKWIVRDITSASVSSFTYGTSAGATPAIISGQGTQTATINFGTTGGKTYRVMCIPYNGDYGTDAAPTDACYAEISIYGSSLTQVSCGLSGTYTIGGTSPDYADFTDAVQDLIDCGITGPVTFNVRTGTYTEQISIPAITGSSATNTITFQAETGVAANVTLHSSAGSSSATDYVVQLNGCSYVKFKDMTVNYSGSSTLYARVFWISGGASYCTIDNCSITGITGTANAGCELIYCKNTGGVNGTDNTISNNTLTNGSYGIYYEGVLSSNTEANLKIFGNTMNNQKANSLMLKYLFAVQVYNNKIYNASGSTSYSAIDLSQCNGDATHYNNVYNNWVTSPFSCISNNSSTYLGVYYNNALTTGTGTTSASATFFTSGGSGSTLKINNNIFVNSGAYVAVYISSTTTINAINNNVYYAYSSSTGEVSKYIGYWGGNVARMAGYKFKAQLTNAGFESNSAGINPKFTSATDLTPTYSGFANKGTAISGITDDINGTARDGSTPDIGATEGSGSTFAALNGTYTVGGSSPSYNTLYEATEELNYFGVSGPVTFNVRNGTYAEQLGIGAVSGISATNNVVYQSVSGDSTTVNIQYACTLNSPYEHFTIHLVNASYITLKQMTIAATDASNGNAIVFFGGANNNKILNNRLQGIASTSNSNVKAVVLSDSDYNNNNNEISYNNITLGSHGIYLSGEALNSLESGIIIKKNILTDQSHFGIYLYNVDAPEVIANKITTTKTYVYDGIYIYYGYNALKLQKNEIYTTSAWGHGINLQYHTGTSSQIGEISNNMIVIGNGVASAENIGILTNVGKYENIWYNTVRVNSAYNSGQSNCAFKSHNTGSNQVIQNNIFVNKGTGAGALAIAVTASASIESLDYNNLYTNGTYMGYWPSANSTDNTLASWKTRSGQDANSVSVDPESNYVSATSDLRLATANETLNNGTLVTLTTDIDDNARGNPSTIGAFEKNSSCTDVAITSATAEESPICSSATTTLTANGVVGTNAVVTWWSGTGGTGTNYGTGLTLNNAAPGTYYARVTGDCGTPQEAMIEVETISAPSTPTITGNTPLCPGTDNESYSVTPITNGSYVWSVDGENNAITGNPYAASTQISFGNNSGNVYVTVSNQCGSANNSMLVTVYAQPQAPVATAATSVTETQFNANWNAVAGATKYFLDVSSVSNFSTYLPGFQNYDAGNALTAVVTGISAGNTYYYRVRAFNCAGQSVNSNIITVNLSCNSPVIGIQPADQLNKCEGQTASFTVSNVTGNTPFSYQWYYAYNTVIGTQNVYTKNYIDAATSGTYTINPVLIGLAGTYSVVVTNICGSATSNDAVLTTQYGANIQLHPIDFPYGRPGGSASFSITTYGNNLTYKWQVFNGSAWSDISDGGSNPAYSNSATSTLSITQLQQSMDQFQYRCIVTDLCANSLTSSPATLSVNNNPCTCGLWIGAQDTLWQNGNNWECLTPPDITCDVVIPGSATYMPVINAGITGLAKSVTINPLASLTVHGTLTTPGTVYVKSDRTGNAGFLQSNSAVLSGTFVVERYLSKNGYYYISSPFNNATVSQIHNFTPVGLGKGYFSCEGYLNPFPNMWKIDEPHSHTISSDYNAWLAPSVGEILTPMRGYCINVTSAPLTISISGTYNNLNGYNAIQYDYNVTRTLLSTDIFHNGTLVDIYGCTIGPNPKTYSLSDGPANGWHLIGNPFPSPINLENPALKSNILAFTSTVAFFRPTTQWYGIYGYYSLYIGGYGAFYPSKYIPAMNSVFVQNPLNAPSSHLLYFNNSMRKVTKAALTSNVFKKMNVNDLQIIKLSASEKGNGLKDEAVVFFTQDANMTLDAIKLLNTADEVPNIYSVFSGVQFAGKSLAELKENTIIPLGFSVNREGEFTISASSISNLPANLTVYLVDTKENKITDLSASDYTFNFAGMDNNRFYLRFSDNEQRTKDNDFCNIYNSENSLVVNFSSSVNNKAKMSIYDITGQLVKSDITIVNGINRTELNVTPGMYLIKVVSDKNVFSKMLKF